MLNIIQEIFSARNTLLLIHFLRTGLLPCCWSGCVENWSWEWSWPALSCVGAGKSVSCCRNNSCCEKSHSPAFFEKFRQELHGRTYEMRQQSIGLFPLFIQVFHNNMTEGIRKISFSCESGIFSVSFLEGEEIHTLPVGFRQAALGTVSMHGENYLVGTLGEFTRNENQIPVLEAGDHLCGGMRETAFVCVFPQWDGNWASVERNSRQRNDPGKAWVLSLKSWPPSYPTAPSWGKTPEIWQSGLWNRPLSRFVGGIWRLRMTGMCRKMILLSKIMENFGTVLCDIGNF